jgi:hypothetical protein
MRPRNIRYFPFVPVFVCCAIFAGSTLTSQAVER